MKIPEAGVLWLDRTQWQFGKCVFNILMLGVVHEGVAFALVWCVLDKKGNSNVDERAGLFNEFLFCFGNRRLVCLTADREVVGKDWFSYLLGEPDTPFRIRIRANHKLNDSRQSLRASVVFQDLQVGQTKLLKQPRWLWGHKLYIAALRLEDGELQIVATQTRPDCAIADYAQRWGIETLFGIFKTRGF